MTNSAQRLLNQFGILYPPVPVVDLAEALGVYEAPYNNDNVPYQRFLTAHAIGHHILYPGSLCVGPHVPGLLHLATIQSSIMEIRCNNFAADLLTSPYMLQAHLAYLPDTKQTFREAAALFGVTEEFMVTRLKYLGCIPEK